LTATVTVNELVLLMPGEDGVTVTVGERGWVVSPVGPDALAS
jgi:hypothetical protein